MSGEIRVKIDGLYDNVYSDWKEILGLEMHELFFLSACIGYIKGDKIPIKKSKDKFWSRTFTPKEWACFYSMLLKDHSMETSIVKDDNHVISTIELYANGGIKDILNNVVEDYVIKGKDYRLDKKAKYQIIERILAYIYEQKNITG
jgi:hypothetical protein